MQNFQLLPHYEAELNERKKGAKKSPNKTQADWELVKLFIADKAKFIQEAFKADVGPTMLSYALSEIRKTEMQKDLKPDWLKQPKAQRLKSIAALGTKSAKKGFQEPPAFLYAPKLKR